MTSLLSSLNQSQRTAVQTIEGPLLIIAGAGTGKTRTLVHRLAYLVAEKEIPPEKLLAITFTTRAAEEMRERVGGLCQEGIDLSSLWVGTIHALCYQILKNEGCAVRFVPDFEIISPTDQAGIIRILAKQFFPQQLPISIKHYALKISREKNELAGLHTSPAGFSPFCQAYQEILERETLLDFDDLIVKTVLLLKKFPDITKQLRSRFSHISVDEYQDINTAQYLLIRELAGPAPNLCAVGDADQAIYAFRGAQVKNFLNFQHDFPQAAIIRLEENYRSTSTIITAARQVIEKNSARIDKKLIAVKPRGPRIELCEMLDEREEARFVAQEIGRLIGGTSFETLGPARDDAGLPAMGFGDIAVLYRLHAQSRYLKKALELAGIPVEIGTSLSLYEEPEVEAVINVLEAMHNPENDFAVSEILQNSVKGIGPKTVTLLRNRAQELNTPLLETIRLKNNFTKIAADKCAALGAFLDMHNECIERSSQIPLDQLIKEIYEKLCKQAVQSQEGKNNSIADNENLLDLITASLPFSPVPASEGIPLFLNKISRLREGETYSRHREAVTLLTVHGAKGLEFPAVFITGLEDGLFPYNANSDSGEEADPEEERRLFYVGMTRAQEKLYLTWAHSRFLFGERKSLPRSTFIADIPEETACCYIDPVIKKRTQEKQAKKPKQMNLFSD